MTVALRKSFSSLSVPNYRRYFTGQLVSISGNWMQNVAEAWLLLTLTGSGVAIGALTAAQFLPFLLFAAWGGVIADRFRKRRLLMVTQSAMAVPALFLLAFAAAGAVEPWMIFVTAFARGSVNAIDNPARQSFVIEMVGPGRVVNAVSLNSVIVQSSRIVGPAFAGVLIALWGVAPCLAVNALTFGVMIVALMRMKPADLRPAPVVKHERGAVGDAIRHVRRTPELAIPLAMMALVGTLAFNFQTVLPLFAHFTFGRGAEGYATLLAAMGAGSIVGALINGARGRTGAPVIVAAALGFGVSGLLAAAAPSYEAAVLAVVPLGAFSVVFASSVNSHLQLEVAPEMRGRVMALYSIVFLGSTPIGGPLTGWLAGALGPRSGLVLAGVAALAAGIGAAVAWHRLRRTERPARPGIARSPGRSPKEEAAPARPLTVSSPQCTQHGGRVRRRRTRAASRHARRAVDACRRYLTPVN